MLEFFFSNTKQYSEILILTFIQACEQHVEYTFRWPFSLFSWSQIRDLSYVTETICINDENI